MLYIYTLPNNILELLGVRCLYKFRTNDAYKFTQTIRVFKNFVQMKATHIFEEYYYNLKVFFLVFLKIWITLDLIRAFSPDREEIIQK